MQIKYLLHSGVKNWSEFAALAMAACGAICFTMAPLRQAQIAEEQRFAGEAWTPVSMWRQESIAGVAGGALRRLTASSTDSVQLSSFGSEVLPSSAPQPSAEIAKERGERKMLRTAVLELVVKNPAESAEGIRYLAEQNGGYLETSQVSGEGASTGASLTIRVPAERFEELRGQIRKLGLRVESEKLEAQDVTKEYVDQESRLRNLRAEEQQYLGILKRASTVSDTMEVSEKLSEVRGQIEQQQAEFETLSKQIQTVAIAVSLTTEAEAQVLGLHWRPLYQLKLALRGGLDGLANYASAMAAIVFLLPAILLWTGTILLGLAVAYRILRWAKRSLFSSSRTVLEKA